MCWNVKFTTHNSSWSDDTCRNKSQKGNRSCNWHFQALRTNNANMSIWFDKPKCNTVWISTAISEQLSSYGTHALHTNTHIHYNNTVDYKVNLYSDLYYVNLYILWTEFYTIDTLLSRNTQTAAILDCIFTDYNTHVLQIITNSEHTHPTGYVTMAYTL